MKCVCLVEGLEKAVILGKRREKSVCLARHIVCYLATKITSRSTPFIGRMMGGRDHTTILHGVRKIAKLRLTDSILDAKVKMYEAALLETQTPPGGPDGAGNFTMSNNIAK
jgi:chromosomal replication initiation ATPase DnaA